MSFTYIIKSKSYEDFDIKNSIYELLDNIMKNHNYKRINKIAIKINLCYYWDFSTGHTTDFRTIFYIISYIREKINPDAKIYLVEADASAMKTKYAFIMLGARKFAKEHNVELYNLSTPEDRQSAIVKVNGKEIEITYSKKLDEMDYVINVAKLKFHRQTGITCALKNIFGAISYPRKFKYHQEKTLHHAIAAANAVIKPDIHIVDGIIALGSYPKKMNVIIGGDNPINVDVISSKIIGYKPSRIKHIKYAKRIIKKSKSKTIFINCNLKILRKEFPKPAWFWINFIWNIQLFLVKMYARLFGDIVPPLLEK
ncbi:MAG: DUF362 domain-containing protein [Candidatus Helarchaeota archaeon]